MPSKTTCDYVTLGFDAARARSSRAATVDVELVALTHPPTPPAPLASVSPEETPGGRVQKSEYPKP